MEKGAACSYEQSAVAIFKILENALGVTRKFITIRQNLQSLDAKILPTIFSKLDLRPNDGFAVVVR